ncbi:hypothetical protein HU200_067674 [Digitaria exilis]|uniref:Disease resistance protein At4g27190-like leucine-rich repeats domain-containing protein n=1 Tax=Digitaria exilis TaxID=1010633 RepID=A0A835DVT5_9POAL|nr:hypothetical protein HU200_067674 [Digitaria exilis]
MQHPPLSLVKEFGKVIHIDCSRWKSRRELQRAIAEELELPKWVNDAFDRRDREEDFSGRDESSRTEIEDISGVILGTLIQFKFLLIFHNGSDDMVDLVSCGVPPPEFFGAKVLWTYRGRLRLGSKFRGKLPSSHHSKKDEFKDMVNLEHLELLRNSIQVLPSMSGAISLKTLILDGCVLLEHVGPEGLPPSLESFSFDSGSDATRISKISLAGEDASLEGIPSNDGGEIPWSPPSDRHVEISEGITLTDVEGENEIMAIHTMIVRQVHSLHVHDNSCMLAVNPKSVSGGLDINSADGLFGLRWCRVERCPKLHMVFMPHTVAAYYLFPNMESIWASYLPMATCIWSKGFLSEGLKLHPLPQLQSIHIHNCPRLKFVLPLSPLVELPNLETLHITHCSDLRQVFPWDDVREPRIKEIIGQASTLKKLFRKLKHIYLHDLPSLHEICEERTWAPMLESIVVRGCWALQRLPAVGFPFLGRRKCIARIDRDCWEKLQWDGIHVAHHPYLYQTRFSSRYYRKQRLLRGTVLR